MRRVWTALAVAVAGITLWTWGTMSVITAMYEAHRQAAVTEEAARLRTTAQLAGRDVRIVDLSEQVERLKTQVVRVRAEAEPAQPPAPPPPAPEPVVVRAASVSEPTVVAIEPEGESGPPGLAKPFPGQGRAKGRP